jgi:hypothetical protein
MSKMSDSVILDPKKLIFIRILAGLPESGFTTLYPFEIIYIFGQKPTNDKSGKRAFAVRNNLKFASRLLNVSLLSTLK